MNQRFFMRRHGLRAALVRAVLPVLGLLLAGCLATPPTLTAAQVDAMNARADRNLINTARRLMLARMRAAEKARLEAERLAAPSTAPELRNALQTGMYHCDLKRRVELLNVHPNRRGATLRWKQRVFNMKAVQAKTGAVRLEDTRSGLVWISIVGKSMLLDTQNGKQLANDCNRVD